MANRDLFHIAIPIVSFLMGLSAGVVIHNLTTRVLPKLSGLHIFMLVFPFTFIAFLIGFLVVDSIYKNKRI